MIRRYATTFVVTCDYLDCPAVFAPRRRARTTTIRLYATRDGWQVVPSLRQTRGLKFDLCPRHNRAA